MKDEELAKEYEEKAEYIEVDDYGKKRYGSIDIQQAVLYGLKAGRPQWHKVADGDLPDNYRYVWTNVGAGYYDGECWRDDFGRLQGVVAWCEPKFEE